MDADRTLMVGISGIRGIAGRSLTPEVVTRFAQAFGTWLPPGCTVVVGNDSRTSRDMMRDAVFAGLCSTGCNVIDLGLCPTPTIKFMVTTLKAGGGIAITASHNPIEWNGLKMIRSDGVFLNAAQGEKVSGLYQKGTFRNQTATTTIEIDRRGLELHIERLSQVLDTSSVRRRRFRVALDACNGVGSIAGVRLLEQLNCEVFPIHCLPDGAFPHNPEPLPQNLTDLCSTVVRVGADLGFAIDPDGDRVALVTEAGIPPGEDYTLAIAVDHVLRSRHGIVVSTLSTSQIVADAAARYNCKFVATKVGEVHVVEEMLKLDAVVGGEGNGGVIVKEIDPGRDALVGMALVLMAMAEQGGAISTLVEDHPKYVMEKRKVAVARADVIDHLVEKVRMVYSGQPVEPVEDGVKLYLGEYRSCPWVHVRASNTEPVIRIVAEASAEHEAKSICDQVEKLLEEDPRET